MRDHSLDKPFDYNILAVAHSGYCLGVKDIDLGFSTIAKVWCVVASSVAHLVKMSKETFNELWSSSMNREKEIFRAML